MENKVSSLPIKMLEEVKIIIPKEAQQLLIPNEKDFFYYDLGITHENLKRNLVKLQAGDKYITQVFKIDNPVSSEDCLNFLRTKNSEYLGIVGLLLVWYFNKKLFPKKLRTLSFGKDNEDNSNKLVPFIRHYERDSRDLWEIAQGKLSNTWSFTSSFIVFIKQSE